MNETNNIEPTTPLTQFDNHDVLDPNEKRLIVACDSQILSKIQSCNQRAAYRHIDNIEPNDYENNALDKGLLVHEGLGEFYTYKHTTPFSVLRSKVFARMEAYAPAKTNLEPKDTNECIDALSRYMRENEHETWEVAFNSGEPIVEKTFAKRLYEDEHIIILYTGVTDLIIKWNNVPRLPVDHKTYSSWFKPAKRTNQFHGYCWASGSKTLIINRIGLGKKLGENERVVVSYSQGQIDEWARNTTQDILDHLAQINRGWFRRNYEACEEYGGCRYKMLCDSAPEHRPTLIRINYKQVPEWSPMSRD